MIFYMTNCHPLPYFLIFSENPCKFPIALPDPDQTKKNCIFLFIAVTVCNVASSVASSVARGGGGAIAPHWHVDQNAEWEKHYVFSTFETVLCTEVDYIVI